MTQDPKAEWVTAPAMAEFAEVLGIPTEYVFAVSLAGSDNVEHFVLYTPDYPTDETMWGVFMQRDADGILQKTSVPRARPGMWEAIKHDLDIHMRKTFGDPEEEV